jgi:hypothetical protein
MGQKRVRKVQKLVSKFDLNGCSENSEPIRISQHGSEEVRADL